MTSVLADYAPIGLIAIGPDDSLVDVNAAARRLLGLDQAPLDGRSLADLLDHSPLPGSPAASPSLSTRDLLNSSEADGGLIWFRRNGDAVVPLRIQATRVSDQPGVSWVLALREESSGATSQGNRSHERALLDCILRASSEYLVLVDWDAATDTFHLATANEAFISENSRHGVVLSLETIQGMELGACCREIMGMPQEKVSAILGRYKAAATTREPLRFVEETVLPDGEPIITEAIITPIIGQDGAVRHLLYCSWDVSRYQRTLVNLQETEERFNALIAELDVGVVVQDKDDEILLINPAAERILGLTRDNVRGVTSRDPRWRLISEDESPLDRGEVPSVIAARERRPVINRVLGSANIETGERLWLQVTATPRLDDDGGLIHVLVTLVDITTQKEAERALRLSEQKERLLNERFELAAESAMMAVWDFDAASGCLEWDKRMYQLYRVDPASVEGPFEAWRQRIHPDDRIRIEKEMGAEIEALQSDVPLDSEFRIIWPDGQVRHIKTFGRRQYDDDGAVVRVTGVNYDVTERRHLEEQLLHSQKMQAIGQLAGGVAHDFNNLLTVIMGHAELLHDMQAQHDEDSMEMARSILQAGEHASLLTQRLLLFGRKATTQAAQWDLNDLVRASGDILRRLIEERIALTLQMTEAALPVVVDRTQVEQVIINLAVNARDAMPGGGEILLETKAEILQPRTTENPGIRPLHVATLIVRDTGHGMDAETLERIFEPFYTTKPVGKGTGLGLSTVYSVIQGLNGKIHVESAPGEGAAFSVHIPLETKTDSNAVTSDPGELRAGRSQRVLLVEDEAPVRKIAKRALEKYGYEVITATCGENALRVYAEVSGNIDLLMTDVVMPNMGGPDLARELRQQQPDLPVIYMSGYEKMDGEDGDSLSQEAVFIRKPFGLKELALAVQHLLDESNPE
jgi:PAS domain S-box-containing protein